jgi:hypothetical protein
MTPKLALTGVFACLILIGWVARSTLAQNASQDPALPSAAPEGQKEPAPILALPSPSVEGPKPQAAQSTEGLKPEQPAELKSTALPPVDSGRKLEAVAGQILEHPGATDDPEKIVQAFVDQNRKEAEVRLNSPKDEAEKL